MPDATRSEEVPRKNHGKEWVIESQAPFVDDFLATYDVQSQHSVEIRASAPAIYEATRSLDLSESWVVRTLFRLRGVPTSALTLDGLRTIRFLPLLVQPPDGFVLGIIGQFWSPSGRLLAFDPHGFADLQTPEYAKAIWSFDVAPTSASTCQLRTITRVTCPDEDAAAFPPVLEAGGPLQRPHTS